MTLSIQDVIADDTLHALTSRQCLAAVEGADVALHPPTYPPPRGERSDRSDPRYTIHPLAGGPLACELDSVQSQANRMERSYRDELADVIPRHVVQAGERQVDLTELAHRLGDASLRATELTREIRRCFMAYELGDAVPMARIGPTSLVYGAWDSRDTRVGVPRAIVSRIEARDITVCTRSAMYSAVYGREELGLSDKEWESAAKAGFAPAPSVGWQRGVLVRGPIVQSAGVQLGVLRTYRTSLGEGKRDVLAVYLLGLALGGLMTGGRQYRLRSGCDLVPAGAPQFETVSVSGERRAVEVSAEAAVQELGEAAKGWSEAANVTLGGDPAVHEVDPAKVKRMVREAAAKPRGRASDRGDG